MCLEIQNFDKNKTFLLFERNLVGCKTFEIYRGQDGIRLETAWIYIKGFDYNFKVCKNFLTVKPNNRKQEVRLVYNVVGFNSELEEYITYNYFKLGFHISFFELNKLNEAFPFEGRFVRLPVLFHPDHIQLVGDDAIVKKFKVPSANLYVKFCKLYDIETNQAIIDLLNEIFKTYSNQN
jgi:hypothetical protein